MITMSNDSEKASLSIVIATCDSGILLTRTLHSLLECNLPSTFRQVIIVENGGGHNLEAVVEKFQDRLQIKYINIPEGNKNLSLNTALVEADDDFIVFFDDDVRIDPACISAYADLTSKHSSGTFIAGNCGVDYEEPPPSWMLQYLPLSAKGWSKGEKICDLDGPEALGFNWGAFAKDIRAVGGFNEDIGPGTKVAIGDETDMQTRLMKSQAKGIYAPLAKVWHWVPNERCSIQWALNRARIHARHKGKEFKASKDSSHLSIKAYALFKVIVCSTVMKAVTVFQNEQTRFKFNRIAYWNKGILEGLKLDKLAHPTRSRR